MEPINPTDSEVIDAPAAHFNAPRAWAVARLAALAVHFDARAEQERIVEQQGAAQ